MRYQLLWLFLAAPLGPSLAACLGPHGPLDTSVIEFNGPEDQEPLSSAVSSSQHEKSGTIYHVLSHDDRFSRLTKALNFVEDVGTLLDDPSAHLTFFAPPDRVLRRPDHGPPSSSSSLGWSVIDKIIKYSDFDGAGYIAEFRDLTDALQLLDKLDEAPSDLPDADKRKKFLKLILRAILNYHIIPTDGYDSGALANNLTYPSNLAMPGAFDGKPLRLRVAQTYIPPATTVNFYTRIVQSNIEASNGVIHVVDHPLLPPPSTFQELYMSSGVFSILTSTLQRSHLTHDLDLRWVREKGLVGASLVTVFAPTNKAFLSLPKKLRLFLFSPFGERVLKKLLQYHIVPGAVVHSNYIHHKHSHKAPVSSSPYSTLDQGHGLHSEGQERKAKLMPWIKKFAPARQTADDDNDHKPHVEPIIFVNLTLETLLPNHTIQAYILQNKINVPFPGPKNPYIIDTKILVNHHPAVVVDVVGLNGAIHAIDRVLDPRGSRHGHRHHHRHLEVEDDRADDVWVDWESWLPQWAEESD
ncbi:hypothetical protein GALMADRAFT_239299 [Galerina marginata CBS 339.88]|uniref:FAS1 domain-containing protein n=1 Tax=Galerina marginata (strain CBS 339.88) TaxID=685588 RepID=A0A067TDY3_GALM3|nr:hypothetical protein GALMADRAFT_239299 [Galerina marginata CBS 339.88]